MENSGWHGSEPLPRARLTKEPSGLSCVWLSQIRSTVVSTSQIQMPPFELGFLVSGENLKELPHSTGLELRTSALWFTTLPIAPFGLLYVESTLPEHTLCRGVLKKKATCSLIPPRPLSLSCDRHLSAQKEL